MRHAFKTRQRETLDGVPDTRAARRAPSGPASLVKGSNGREAHVRCSAGVAVGAAEVGPPGPRSPPPGRLAHALFLPDSTRLDTVNSSAPLHPLASEGAALQSDRLCQPPMYAKRAEVLTHA